MEKKSAKNKRMFFSARGCRLACLPLFLLLFAFAESSETVTSPYIIRHEGETDGRGGDGSVTTETATFSLCLGSIPSKKLRTSLLMCRDLSYPFCINSAIIGSILRLDSHVAKKFTETLAEPRYSSIENLAWLVDSALVVLYDTFSARSNARVECAYEWHSWICSRVFKRAYLNESQLSQVERKAVIKSVIPLPVGVCEHVCRRTEIACDWDLQCHKESPPPSNACTDYYNDSAVCGSVQHSTLEYPEHSHNLADDNDKRQDEADSSSRHSPVFGKRKHKYKSQQQKQQQRKHLNGAVRSLAAGDVFFLLFTGFLPVIMRELI